jgi:hypothetical protein
MDNTPVQPQSTPSDPDVDAARNRRLIIQPSARSIADIQASQEESSSQQPPLQAPISSPDPLSPPPRSLASSIYPEATKGIGVSPLVQDPVVPSTEASPVDRDVTGKTLIIRLVAALIVFINLFNSYNWLAERHAGYTSWLTIIEIIVIVYLAVRIFRLSESARSAYVFIAGFLFTLSCVAILSFIVSNRGHAVPDSIPKSPHELTELKDNLVATENNPRLTPLQKKGLENAIQTELNEQSDPVGYRSKEYLSEALVILVTAGPIIFFTRPSIKAVFS